MGNARCVNPMEREEMRNHWEEVGREVQWKERSREIIGWKKKKQTNKIVEDGNSLGNTRCASPMERKEGRNSLENARNRSPQ